MEGKRKFLLGLAFLAACLLLDLVALFTADGSLTFGEAGGLAAMNGGLASGVVAIVWGNAQEWRAKRNGPGP